MCPALRRVRTIVKGSPRRKRRTSSRSSQLQMFFKIGVLKFRKFHRKTLVKYLFDKAGKLSDKLY